VQWSENLPWPSGTRWKYPRPTFRGCLGGPVDLVEILDEDELVAHGYRVTGKARPHIPDFLGRTRSNQWILYESKSDDQLGLAVDQLSDGLAELRRLHRAVDKLGIVLNRVASNEDYYVMRAGRLLAHRSLFPGTPILLGDNQLPVMVEERRTV
jgi:hypothetical protein